MPTNKPRIQALLEEPYYKKFLALKKLTGRSESNLGGKIIKDYIDQFEEEHGEIKIEEE